MLTETTSARGCPRSGCRCRPGSRRAPTARSRLDLLQPGLAGIGGAGHLHDPDPAPSPISSEATTTCSTARRRRDAGIMTGPLSGGCQSARRPTAARPAAGHAGQQRSPAGAEPRLFPGPRAAAAGQCRAAGGAPPEARGSQPGPTPEPAAGCRQASHHPVAAAVTPSRSRIGLELCLRRPRAARTRPLLSAPSRRRGARRRSVTERAASARRLGGAEGRPPDSRPSGRNLASAPALPTAQQRTAATRPATGESRT